MSPAAQHLAYLLWQLFNAAVDYVLWSSILFAGFTGRIVLVQSAWPWLRVPRRTDVRVRS